MNGPKFVESPAPDREPSDILERLSPGQSENDVLLPVALNEEGNEEGVRVRARARAGGRCHVVAPQLVAGMGERLYVAGLNLYRAEQLKQQKKSETGDQNHITCRECKQGRALKAPGALILAKLCPVALCFDRKLVCKEASM